MVISSTSTAGRLNPALESKEDIERESARSVEGVSQGCPCGRWVARMSISANSPVIGDTRGEIPPSRSSSAN
jgi:hypothetical protein